MRRPLLALALVASGCALAPQPRPAAPAPELRAATCPTEAPAPQSDDAAALLGKPIEKVCLLNTAGASHLALEKIVAPSEGQPLTAAGVAQALERLVLAGTVREARALAQPLPSGGVVLTYVVSEYPLVSRVGFEGVKSVPVDALGDLSLGYAYGSPRALRLLGEKMAELYKESGFYGAKVVPRLSALEPGRAEVVFVVEEGPLTTVGALRFVGARQLTEAELMKGLRTKLKGPYLEQQASDDAAALTELYLEKGMINAKVTASTAPGKAPGALEVLFTIDEGPRYTLGKLSLTGQPLGDAKALLAQFESKSGAAFSRATLRRDLERLRARAAQKGLDVTLTPVTTIAPGATRIDLAIDVEKQKQP